MKRIPLCALLLTLLCAVARADYPTWAKNPENPTDWKVIVFKDDNQVNHELYCRAKECMPAGKPASGQLFVFAKDKPDEIDGISAFGAAKGFFKATLSHYSLKEGKIVRDDGHAGPAIDLKKDMSDAAWRKYSSVVIEPPTAMANDGAPAGTVATEPGGTPSRKPEHKHPAPVPGDTLDADVDKALADVPPIEKAIIKKLATREELQALVKDPAKQKPVWHAKALDAARKDTNDPSKHPLLDYLKTQGISDKDFASYVGCDSLLGLPASTDGGSSTLETLKSMVRQLQIPGTDPESIKTQGDVFTAIRSRYPNLQKYCQDQAAAGKVTEQQKPGEPPQSLNTTPPPPPSSAGGLVGPGSRSDPIPAAPAGSASKGDDKSGGDWKDAAMKGAIGGLLGFLAGSLLATMFPVTGLFVLGAALAGAFIGLHMASKKKDPPK